MAPSGTGNGTNQHGKIRFALITGLDIAMLSCRDFDEVRLILFALILVSIVSKRLHRISASGGTLLATV